MPKEIARMAGPAPECAPTPLSERFSIVHDDGLWGSAESVSGPGSERGAAQVDHALKLLNRFVAELGVRSMADIPCGDFNWMPLFLETNPQVQYTGYDVVPHLVAGNRRRHPGVEFRWLDITLSRPASVDLILCKDLLNHLTEADVFRALENMAASAKYVLVTTNRGFENVELTPGHPHASRHLDLEAPPYSLGEPLYGDHYMLLYKGADLVARLSSRPASSASA